MHCHTRVLSLPLGLAVALALSGIGPGATSGQGSGLDKINHIIIIYQENRSFDSLYGKFPGANGFTDAGAAVRQVNKDGQP